MAKEKSNLETMRHSLSHILAAAVLDMFPEAKLAIGPAIENGFYYDFDLPRTLIPEDLPILEKKMKHLVKQNLKFERQDVPIDEALKIVKKAKQPYKTELIEDLKKAGKKKVSFYKTGAFIDLCEGPHVASTKDLGAFKLSHISGAYWKGDEKNKMLQRIYAYAFQTQKELDEFLKNLEEAKKRDHRRIGKDLDLFSFHTEAPGMVFWHPKGMVLREALMKPYNEMHLDQDYKTISTPILLNEEMWHRSGHWDNYKDNMYFTKLDNKSYAIKPMNCPGSILIYSTRPRSYREFPIKFCEPGEIHRHEPSGTLNGLFRVRAFRQDDAHIFALPEQVESEIEKIIELTNSFYKIFSFKDIHVELSTRPEKSIGSDEVWNKSESILKKTLKKIGIKYTINEGDGAFYGPKIDFHIKDSLGRSWQCGTIQLDFSMPERFNLNYVDKDGKLKRPVMIHRTVIGSIQRFVGVLIEHFAGNFPLWLAPVQVKVIPVSEKFEKFARGIEEELKTANLRVEFDVSDESVGKKIRNAELQKIPYMLILGEKEVKSKKLAVRSRKSGDLGQVSLKKLIDNLKREIEEKK